MLCVFNLCSYKLEGFNERKTNILIRNKKACTFIFVLCFDITSIRLFKTPFLSPWKETGFCIPKESRQGKYPLNPSGTVGKRLRSTVALNFSLLAPRFGLVKYQRGTPHALTLARGCKSCTAPGVHPIGGRSPLIGRFN